MDKKSCQTETVPRAYGVLRCLTLPVHPMIRLLRTRSSERARTLLLESNNIRAISSWVAKQTDRSTAVDLPLLCAGGDQSSRKGTAHTARCPCRAAAYVHVPIIVVTGDAACLLAGCSRWWSGRCFVRGGV
jgi:hypothetical protein